jgi:hypothetical protein
MQPLEVLQFYQFGNDDFRAIISSNNGSTVYASQMTSEVFWCACLGYRFRGKCSHQKILLQTIKERGTTKVLSESYFKTSLESINKVLMGGLPLGSITGFYAQPQAGKSTTSAWLLLDIMNQRKGNGLYIDTEMGMARQFLPDLVARFNAKYKTDFGIRHIKINYRNFLKEKSPVLDYTTISDDEKDFQIVVVDIPTFEQLSLFVGNPYTLDMDVAKPKLTPFLTSLYANIWDSPIARLLEDPNSDDEDFVGFVMDSFTNTMKQFGVDNQAFPVRDTAQSVVLNQVSQLLSEYFNMIGIVIFHSSKNHTDKEDIGKPVGGKSVGHSCKHIVLFSSPERKGLNTEVTISAYRLPTNVGSHVDTITINDKGVF